MQNGILKLAWLRVRRETPKSAFRTPHHTKPGVHDVTCAPCASTSAAAPDAWRSATPAWPYISVLRCTDELRRGSARFVKYVFVSVIKLSTVFNLNLKDQRIQSSYRFFRLKETISPREHQNRYAHATLAYNFFLQKLSRDLSVLQIKMLNLFRLTGLHDALQAQPQIRNSEEKRKWVPTSSFKFLRGLGPLLFA